MYVLSNDLMQELLKLERIQEELVERCGRQPTSAEWAVAAGLDTKTLREHLNYGTQCKDKMIKSNIRLVISIAKNFQGAGMSIQDLVQVLLLPYMMDNTQIFFLCSIHLNTGI